MNDTDEFVMDKMEEIAEFLLENNIYPPAALNLLRHAIWKVGTRKYTRKEFLERTNLNPRTVSRYKEQYGA